MVEKGQQTLTQRIFKIIKVICKDIISGRKIRSNYDSDYTRPISTEYPKVIHLVS